MQSIVGIFFGPQRARFLSVPQIEKTCVGFGKGSAVASKYSMGLIQVSPYADFALFASSPQQHKRGRKWGRKKN